MIKLHILFRDKLTIFQYFYFFSVPGGSDGPSGVLICSENYITYKNFGDQPDIRCPIPRRRVSPVHLINWVLLSPMALFVPRKLFIMDPNLPLTICLFVTYYRMTWMIQSEAWYSSAPPPTRQSLCSFSSHKLSRETSLRWRLKRMKKWWVNTVDDNQVL